MFSRTGPLQLVLCMIIFPFLYSVTLVVFVVNESVRLVVRIILRVQFGDDVILIEDGCDAFITQDIEGQLHNATIFFIVPKGSLTPKNVAEFYEANVQNFVEKKTGRRIYAKLENITSSAYGYMCWRRDLNFNVRNHIIQQDTETVFTKKTLTELYTKEYSSPLPDSKPQWQISIIPKYDDGSGAIKSILHLYTRHNYMDGISAAMIWKNCFCPTSELGLDPVTFKVSLVLNFLMHLKSFFYLPLFFFALAWERHMLQMWIPNPDKISPRQKFFAWDGNPVDLADMKIIKSWAGAMDGGCRVSISNVLSTAILRAMRATFPKERLVEDLIFLEVVAILPYPNYRLRNRISYMTYSIPKEECEVQTSPVAGLLRDLKQIKALATKAMSGPDVLGTFYMQKYFGKLPRFLGPLWLKGGFSSIAISPLPWSKKKGGIASSLCNVPVERIRGIASHASDLGLVLCCETYGDEISFGGTGDSSWVSREELNNLVVQIGREVSKMVEIVDSNHKEVNFCEILELN